MHVDSLQCSSFIGVYAHDAMEGLSRLRFANFLIFWLEFDFKSVPR